MNFERKLQAIELRRNGLSYSEIRKSIPASKSTLSTWLKDIELTPEQRRKLTKLQATGYIGAKSNQAKSIEKHNHIKEEAGKEFLLLVKQSEFISGLMLYWAEGSKRSGDVQFSNSDSQMIYFMMNWFRKFCEVPEDKFRIGLFVHTLHLRENYLEFWSKVTSLPLRQFNKPYVKPTIFSSKKNKLYYGTCVIKIHNKELYSKIIGWIDGFKNYFINYVRPTHTFTT